MTAAIIHFNNSLASSDFFHVHNSQAEKTVITEQVPHPSDDVLLIHEHWLGN